MTLDLSDLSFSDVQHYLQSSIAPRPICFASTIDKEGSVNLSPFSFFNLFSIHPPIVVFSPSRRLRDNSTKHSLQNVQEVPELVIHIVDDDMVQQTSLASCEYPKGINEFEKAGFTQIPATLVRPPMIRESKVKMECRVLEIKPLGKEGGAGNLVICEVLRIHIDEVILDENKKIDQLKLHQVARMGGNWYCRVDESNLFIVEKPNTELGMGVDQLPASIRNSQVLTGNNLAQLANLKEIPPLDPGFDHERLRKIFQYYSGHPEELETELHRYAKELLSAGKTKDAWQVLLSL
ncbi:MAG: flavin reductase family protein [Chitinophagales bacterium]